MGSPLQTSTSVSVLYTFVLFQSILSSLSLIRIKHYFKKIFRAISLLKHLNTFDLDIWYECRTMRVRVWRRTWESCGIVGQLWARVLFTPLSKPFVLLFSSGMLSNAVIPPTDEHAFAQWREREEKSRTANTTKQAGGLIEVKGEDGANISTPLSRRPVSGQYRDLSMRLRLTGNNFFIII